MGAIFYALVRNSFKVFYTLYNRLEIKGRENVPSEPVVVVANHTSHADPPLMAAAYPMRPPIRYIGKEELFKGRILGTALHGLGVVPVSREDSQRAGAVLKLMLSHLNEGRSVLVFPEGTRSRDGRIRQPLEGGAAFLSIKSGRPILPAYISGSFKVLPPGAKFPRPVKLRVTYGELIRPPEEGTDREKREATTGAILDFFLRMEREADDRSRAQA